MSRPVSEGFWNFILDDGALRIELRRSSRRSIGISVEPGGTVVVTAPRRASMGRIHKTLQKHGEWVRGKVSKLREVPPPPPPPKWVEGELHTYLGHPYPLRLVESDERGVWRTDQELLVHLPKPRSKEMVRKVVEGWMSESARTLFSHRMNALIRSTPALNLRKTPTLKLRRMKARWGSCSPQGTILMNTYAIQLPLRLVDYILMHELCHLKVPNHSRDFWAYLERCMPDWEKRKVSLDASGS